MQSIIIMTNGDAVLLNVLHHLFSSGTDTSDRVYSTSKAIIEKYKIDLEYFLSKIGKELHLKISGSCRSPYR
jgi:hypothetical protein